MFRMCSHFICQSKRIENDQTKLTAQCTSHAATQANTSLEWSRPCSVAAWEKSCSLAKLAKLGWLWHFGFLDYFSSSPNMIWMKTSFPMWCFAYFYPTTVDLFQLPRPAISPSGKIPNLGNCLWRWDKQPRCHNMGPTTPATRGCNTQKDKAQDRIIGNVRMQKPCLIIFAPSHITFHIAFERLLHCCRAICLFICPSPARRIVSW